MKSISTDPLFEAAAAEACKKLRRDQKRVSSPLRPILAAFEQHLSDPDFKIGQLADSYQLEARRKQFRKELGLSYKRYFTRCRIEAGAWLLRETDLEIWRISEFLGYGRPSSFARDFKIWSDVTPTTYRRENSSSSQSSELSRSSEFWWHLIGWNLNPVDELRLLHWLEGRPAGTSTSETKSLTSSRIEIKGDLRSQQMAEKLWKALASEPQPTRLLTVRRLAFCTSDFFELLGRKTLEEGRKSRRFGVEIAELALASLEASDDHLENLLSLRALGWARLGNAYRLAGDFVAAERAFHKARKECRAKTGINPRTLAEILDLEASFRLFQGRYREALDLLNRSIVISRREEDRRRLTSSLLQRSALYVYRVEPEAALPDLREARDLVEAGEEDPYLDLLVHQDLAGTYTLVGTHGEARRALNEARRRCDRTRFPLNGFQLDMIEGQISLALEHFEEAEHWFRKARAGFLLLEEPLYCGVACLELAQLHRSQGRSSQALFLASEALAIFETYGIGRESLSAEGLLREAIIDQELTWETLNQASRVMRRLAADLTL